jgi:hypothetical protein
MQRRRVAVVYVHSLFGRGVARLLEADQSLEVECLRADLADTQEKVRRFNPQTIVVEECGQGGAEKDAVRDLPPALVISVRPQDNVMEIYSTWQEVAARPEDLLQAVHLELGHQAPGLSHPA